jgi:hypothetical protein
MPRLRCFYDLYHLHYVTSSIPRDRARPFDSEQFKRKFVTTLAHLRGELGFRVLGCLLIPQGGTVTYCSSPRTPPTPPRLCRPLVAQGPRSDLAALPATRVLAASQTGQRGLGLAPHRIRFPRTYRPRRQNHGAVEKPSAIKIGGLESEPCATSSSLPLL